MSKTFKREPVNIGAVGHVDYGKTTLSKAIAAELESRSNQKREQPQIKGFWFDEMTGAELPRKLARRKSAYYRRKHNKA